MGFRNQDVTFGMICEEAESQGLESLYSMSDKRRKRLCRAICRKVGGKWSDKNHRSTIKTQVDSILRRERRRERIAA